METTEETSSRRKISDPETGPTPQDVSQEQETTSISEPTPDAEDSELEEIDEELDDSDIEEPPLRPFFKRRKPSETNLPYYMIPEPVIDPRRTNRHVVEDLKRREFEWSPEADLIEAFNLLDRSIYGDEVAPMQSYAIFYLKSYIFPVISAVANTKGMTLNAYVMYLLQRNMSLATPFVENEGWKTNPHVLAASGMIRSFTNLSDEEILESAPWWLEKINYVNPQLHQMIISHPRGEIWFTASLKDLFRVMRGAF